MKSVLSYEQYLFEKKSNSDLATGTPTKGKSVTKQVNNNLTAGTPKGKSVKKSVNTGTSSLPKGKGSVPGKSVKTGTSSLPKGKGSVPSKNVDSKFAKITVKGSSVNRKVDSART